MKKLATTIGLILYCLFGALTNKTQAQAESCGFGAAMQAAMAQIPALQGILEQSDLGYETYLTRRAAAQSRFT